MKRIADGISLITQCAYCGIDVQRRQSEIKSFRRTYCSIEHKQLGSRKEIEERECKACKKKFSVKVTEKKVYHCSFRHGMWTRNERSLDILPMRLAWENGGNDAFIASVKEHCTISEKACWVPNWTTEEYTRLTLPGFKATQLHRILLIMTSPLQSDLDQAHHTCSNNRCVNPGHLQWLSPHNNLAEMKERSRYILRIKKLEKALQELDPNHRLLKTDILD